MSDLVKTLSIALDELPFVQVVENSQQGAAVNALCRVKPGEEAQWATLAEFILREAAKREGSPEYWYTHIARAYMLRNGNFVYGWMFCIQAEDLDRSLPIVIGLVNRFSNSITQAAPTRQNTSTQQTPYRSAPVVVQENYETGTRLPENDEDYTEPEGPLAKGAVPEADERGNPIVPREHRVEAQPMAGLPRNYDRNAPDPKKAKGSWHIESRKGAAFRPPVLKKR